MSAPASKTIQQCTRCPLKFFHYRLTSLCDVCSAVVEAVRRAAAPRSRGKFRKPNRNGGRFRENTK